MLTRERERTSLGMQTMFSMPLAYPSTLDRVSASYVEGLWSPALAFLR
jgi:hypothetical protein